MKGWKRYILHILITRDEQEHEIIIKRSTHQEYITVSNKFAPNTRTPKYRKQNLTELKGKNGQGHNYIAKCQHSSLSNQ